MAQRAKTILEPPTGLNWREEQEWMDNLTREGFENCERTGTLVGFVAAFPYADSAAYYRVKKEKPLTLEWIVYCDAWSISDAHLRGLRLKDIKALYQREMAWHNLARRNK